jgi:hypothetical protein
VAKLGIWSLMLKVNMVWKHFLEELFWSAAEASLVKVKYVGILYNRSLYMFKTYLYFVSKKQ